MATFMAIAGMCFSQTAFAIEAVPAVADVALNDGGALHGQVVDLQGGGVADVPVTVRSQDQQVATATTAPDGTFGVQGLKGGVYHVATAKGHGIYRLWSAGTAPPAAQNTAVVYAQNGAVDSNAIVYTGGGGFKNFIANPWVIGAIVATAVAVPVALANSHHSSP
jgi:hypothetical protein